MTYEVSKPTWLSKRAQMQRTKPEVLESTIVFL